MRAHDSITDAIDVQLQGVEPSSVTRMADLSRLSRWGIGGKAAAVVEPRNLKELAFLLRRLSKSKVPHCVIGATSNILFDSKGFEGILIRVGNAFADMEIDSTAVIAGAGVTVPELARVTGLAGLTGLEHTVGIPGTLGGLVAMNGGSNRSAIGDVVDTVTGVTRHGRVIRFTREECNFAYRNSIFLTTKCVITRCSLQLNYCDPGVISARMSKILASRADKFPSSALNCGSTFVSDPAFYEEWGSPGSAIEAAGLKGERRGGAEISNLHGNFINNLGSASSDDVLTLIARARREVESRTGFLMSCEVRYLTADGSLEPAHIAADRLESIDLNERTKLR